MPCTLRYHVKPSWNDPHKYYVLDTRGPLAVTQRLFGRNVIYYNTHSAAQTVADALNKEDMLMHDYDPTPARPLRTQFWLFKRNGATNMGYMPQRPDTGGYWAANRAGAEAALQAHLAERRADDRTGEYLVQSPHGAWTFEVKPPEPAPLVIEAV